MDQNPTSEISIQVSLSGYFFKLSEGGAVVRRSDHMAADKIFTTPEFQKRYSSVEISLLTRKVALVPSCFFDPASAREELSRTVSLQEGDEVESVSLPEYAAELVYSLSIGEMLSKTISRTVLREDGTPAKVLPEMFYDLRDLQKLEDYNRIVASFADGLLHLAIGQGKNLLLANVFEAADFTTAEYFIFLSLKKLQLNPEASVICFRTPVSPEEELSLYRYFKSVEQL